MLIRPGGSSVNDYRGCRVTGASPVSLELYESALAAFQRGHGDALGLARQATAESPAFVAARQLECALLLCSRDVRDFEAAARLYGPLGSLEQNPREYAHGAAIAAAIDGDYARASRIYDQILRFEPRDAAALVIAHVFDYYLGNPAALRERPARVRSSWTAALPGYHAVLSMLAYGLVECGEYGPAEEAARRALELEPLDVRAHHAVAHVLEMQGKAEDGVRWMGSRAAHWTGTGATSTHLWWHLALYHLALGQPGHALLLYDARIPGRGLSELIDASALLWRLHLSGIESGGRFAALAERWEPHAEDAHCAFNDLHAMMAFVGAGRWDCTGRLLAAQERRVALTGGANREMTRLVGQPACRALAAFGRGDFMGAEVLLRALPPVAHRIGGSHAQRDVLMLTRAAAALRRSHLAQGELHASFVPARQRRAWISTHLDAAVLTPIIN